MTGSLTHGLTPLHVFMRPIDWWGVCIGVADGQWRRMLKPLLSTRLILQVLQRGGRVHLEDQHFWGVNAVGFSGANSLQTFFDFVVAVRGHLQACWHKRHAPSSPQLLEQSLQAGGWRLGSVIALNSSRRQRWQKTSIDPCTGHCVE